MNPGIPTRWSPERIAAAVAILRRHTRMSEAIAEMGRTFEWDVTPSALDAGLRRNGRARASTHLGKDSPPRSPQSPPPSAPPPQPSARVEVVRDTEPRIPIFEAVGDLEREVNLDEPVPALEERQDETLSELHTHRLQRENAELKSARKRLLADIADKQQQIEVLKELRASKPLGPIEERPTVGAKQRQGVPVLICSDWHVEEPVDPKTVNGMNEYSLDIAERCIDRLVDAFEWLLRDSRYDCRTAVIALLGDLLSGYIHAELEEKNFLSPTQAILWLAERIERMLRKIAARCPELERIIVVCCDGNHGRNTFKIRVSTRTANSLEWLLYHTLAAKMADDPRFEFRIADGEWLYLDLYNRTIAFTHGDSFQYGGGVGGISIPIRRGISRQFQGRSIAKFCMGHFHQQQDFGDILINGSMIGYSPYAMRVHAPFEHRKQSWFLWDSRNGQALSAPVWL